MRTFTSTEHIERPPARVFAFMMDFRQASRWRNLVRRMEIIGGGPPRTGSEILVTFDVMGKTRQVVSTLFAYDPPRRFVQRNTESESRASSSAHCGLTAPGPPSASPPTYARTA